jgi:hypothetical protein
MTAPRKPPATPRDDARSCLIEMGYRALIAGLIALWIIYPPQRGTPPTHQGSGLTQVAR